MPTAELVEHSACRLALHGRVVLLKIRRHRIWLHDQYKNSQLCIQTGKEENRSILPPREERQYQRDRSQPPHCEAQLDTDYKPHGPWTLATPIPSKARIKIIPSSIEGIQLHSLRKRSLYYDAQQSAGDTNIRIERRLLGGLKGWHQSRSPSLCNTLIGYTNDFVKG
jgi:hypothetical protein